MVNNNKKINMNSFKDPLKDFDWSTLYSRYDRLCSSFNRNLHYLKYAQISANSDRELYYLLIKRFDKEKRLGRINPNTYKGVLYWKLYSQPAALANILKKLEINTEQQDLKKRLSILSKNLPTKISKEINQIIVLLKIEEFAIYGMKAQNSLPVRTTFLHFMYPKIVPVFDKMVLQAVGFKQKNANHDIKILEQYIPYAWGLADKYRGKFNNKWSESPIRLIDMALWVIRGNKNYNYRDE